MVLGGGWNSKGLDASTDLAMESEYNDSFVIPGQGLTSANW
jgi:hypothetical protein